MMFQRKTASHTSILEKAGRCFISKSPPPQKMRNVAFFLCGQITLTQ